MRVTNILCQVNYHRHFKRIWKRQGKMEVKEYVMSPELQEMGIEIKDAKDILHETKMFKPSKTNKFIPHPPSVFTQEMPYYRMHSDVRVTEGENQVLALTKTVPYQGLPMVINSLVGIDSLPNQDELVQTNILQALVWDAMQDKLPKIVDPNRPGYVFKRAYGIENEKKVSNLLDKMSYLCDLSTGKYAECFQRHKIFNAHCELGIKQLGSNIVFQLPCDILLKAQKPLQRFASPDEVMATQNVAVPNIYPIKPILDLQKCITNPLKNQEVSHDPFGRLHTLFVAQKTHKRWLPAQLLAKAISTCFSFTAVEAQNIYGVDVGILPEPISIQCMYLDVKYANFLTYQLNTLNLNDNEGIKNQVWIDTGANLYQSISEVDLISDYNSSVFQKMLAFHSNGLCSSN